MLGHGLAVSAGGVAQQHLLPQQAGLEVHVRARGIELEKAQLLRARDEGGGDVADDRVGLGGLGGRHLLRGDIEEAAAGGRSLQLCLVALLHRQRDEDRFHIGTVLFLQI